MVDRIYFGRREVKGAKGDAQRTRAWSCVFLERVVSETCLELSLL